MKTPLSDAQLLRALMTKYGWTQEDVATHLLFHQTQVSKVINHKITLRPATRKKAEELYLEEFPTVKEKLL